MAKLFSFIVVACLLQVLNADNFTDDWYVQSGDNFTDAAARQSDSNAALVPVDTAALTSRNKTKIYQHDFVDAAQRCPDIIYLCVNKCPNVCQFITHRCISERKMCFDICCCVQSRSLNRTCTSLD